MSTAESSRMTPSLWNFGEEAGEAAKKKSGGRHGTVNQHGGQRKRSEEVLRI